MSAEDSLESQVASLVQSTFLSFLGDFPVALVVLDEQRRIVYMNEKAESYAAGKGKAALGLKPGQAFSCPNSDTAECGAGPYCAYCGLSRGFSEALEGLASSIEWSLGRSLSVRAEQLDLQLWAKPFEREGVRCLLLAALDVSERKRREMLERIFLHDLLNTAGSLASLLRLMDASTGGEFLLLARSAADQLVDELLSQRLLSDAEAGSLPSELAILDAGAVCAEVGELYARLAEVRELRFEMGTGCGPVAFQSDPVLLKRVLSNLLKNALEASKRGDLVSLTWKRDGECVEFAVANAAAMPEAVRAKLFTRSFSTKGRGRGVGTYAAKLFAEEYLGGTLGCESSPGAGTVFTVRLPLFRA